MAEDGLSPGRYTANYLKLGMYAGKVHALPTSPASAALYYNKAHFAFYMRPRYWGRVARRIWQNPRELRDYWWLARESVNALDWMPSPINPGSSARA